MWGLTIAAFYYWIMNIWIRWAQVRILIGNVFSFHWSHCRHLGNCSLTIGHRDCLQNNLRNDSLKFISWIPCIAHLFDQSYKLHGAFHSSKFDTPLFIQFLFTSHLTFAKSNQVGMPSEWEKINTTQFMQYWRLNSNFRRWSFQSFLETDVSWNCTRS